MATIAGGNALDFFRGIQNSVANNGLANTQNFLGANQLNQRPGGNPLQFFNALNTAVDRSGAQNVAGFLGANQVNQFGNTQQKDALKFFGARAAAGPENADRFFNQIGTNLTAAGKTIEDGEIIDESGLAGALNERSRGQDLSLGIIGDATGVARGDITAGTASALESIQEGAGGFDEFLSSGQSASQLQAAQSGALGPEAQAAAFAAFRDSPGQEFLREQGRGQVLAGSAATGGLGSGEVQRDLTRFGTGLAAQDFQNQFNRLGTQADRGLQAAGGRGSLFGQAAGIQAGSGIDLAGTALKGGFGRAGVVQDTTQLNAADRFRTGESLAGAITDFSTGQADLVDAQGRGVGDIVGGVGGNIASIMQGAGINSAADQQRFLTLLSSVSVGQGAAQQSGAQFLESGGSIEDLAALSEGIGTFISSLDL